MNGFFVTVGCIVIAVLATLLIGPHFVDWTQHRAWFEREASIILGTPVRVGGAVDLRLLPQPAVHFEKVTVGNGPKADIGRFTLKLAATPLLRGEVRVSELAIEGARINAVLAEDGSIAWPVSGRFAGEQADRAVLEAVTVTNASFRLTDRAGRPVSTIEAINFEGEARSLGGPYRAEGGFRIAGQPHQFRISTSRVENAAIRVKASGARSDLPIQAEIDGAIAFAGTKPVFTGRTALARHRLREDPTALPWRFEAVTTADPGRIALSPFELAYGPEDQRAVLTGAAQRRFGASAGMDVSLSARQLDLDRLFGADGQGTGVGARLARLVGIAPVLAGPPAKTSLRLDVTGLVVGEGVISGLRLDMASAEAGWSVKSLEATLPGSSPLTLSGSIDLTPGRERFEGAIGLESENFSVLRSWIAGPSDSAGLALSPAKLEAEARLSLGREGLAVSDLSLSLAEARLSGRFGYREGRLDAALVASRLDLDRLLPEETRRRGLGLVGWLPSGLVEAAVQLDADALTIAGVRAEDMSTAVRLAGDTLAIERFSVSRLGGATIQASGRVAGIGRTPDGRIEITAKADDLSGLTKLLLATEAGRTAGEVLDRRQRALAPLDLKATLAFAPENGVAAGRLVIRGTAGGSGLDAEADLKDVRDGLVDGNLALRLALTNPSATQILGQVGLPVLPIESVGPGELSLTATGPLDGDVRLEGHLAGFESRLGVSGVMRPFATEGRPAELNLTGRSGNLAILAPVLGFGLPDPGTALPLTLSARLARDRDRAWTLDGVSGELAGSRFRGNLVLTPSDERLGVRGALEAGDLDLAALISSGLGGDLQTSFGSGVWSDRPFADPALSRFEGEILLQADRAKLIPGADLSGVRARLTFGSEGFALRDLESRLAGGHLKGNLEGRLSGQGSRRVFLRARLEGARMEEIVWRSSDRPVVSGGMTLSADLEAEGRTPASLVSLMTGNGSLHVEGGEIRGLNPLAFASIIRASDSGLELKEDRVREVFAGHLASGVIPVERADGAFAVSGGVMRLRNLSFESPAASSFASARLDLSRLDVEADWSLAVKTPVEGMGQQPPPVALLFRGPVAAPTRSLDVSALIGFLNVRAFEKEVERLEAMQADILERERFSRELIRFGEKRRERERAIEAARKAEEAARAAAEAEASKAAVTEKRPEEPTGSAGPQATGGPTPLLPPTILAPVDPRTVRPTTPQRRPSQEQQTAQPRRSQPAQQPPQQAPQPQQPPVQAPPPPQQPNVLERLFGVQR